MATDARGHTVPAATDHPARAAFLNLALSIRDAIPVTNATTRASTLAALAALTPSITPSSSNPIYFEQADLPAAYRNLYTVDGSNFISLSGAFVWTNAAARGAATTMAVGDKGYQADTQVTYAYNGSWLRSQPGDALVEPASVAGSGVSLSGATVVFTGASTVSLNGCFPTDFEEFEVIIETTAQSAAVDVAFKLRAAGTDSSTGYGWVRGSDQATARTVTTTTSTTGWVIGTNGQARSSNKIFLGLPNVAQATTFRAETVAGPVPVAQDIGGHHSVASAFDGLTIAPSSGTITGTVRVYGKAK